MKNIKIFFLIISFSTQIGFVYAQDESNDNYGEIQERQVVINKNLEIELPQADRNFEKIPPPSLDDKPDENLHYAPYYIDNEKIPDITPTLRVLKIKTEKPPLLYNNYAKVGFGNYISPYLALHLHNSRNKTTSLGASLFHYSSAKGSVDGKNSGDGHSEARVYGKYMGQMATVGGSLSYNVDTYRYYGYKKGIEVDRDTIKQTFNHFKAGLNLENSNPDSDLTLKGELTYSHKNDKFDVSEDNIDVFLNGFYPVTENVGAGLDADLDFRTYKASSTTTRNLISLKPYFTYQQDQLFVKAGFRIISNSDNLDNVKTISIFPAINADYYLSDNLIVFGFLDGDVEKINFTNITDDNPYIKTDIPFYNSIKNLELGGGIRGTLANNLGYKASASFSGYRNMYFFINDSLETNKFDVIYDEDITNILKLKGSLNYSIDKKYGAEISLAYYGYSTGDVGEAWHKPKTDINLAGWYNIYDKIIISSDVRLLSGIKAFDPISLETIRLSSAVDWNAEINYKFSEQAGAFIMLNNILNKKYEIFYNYPIRGLLVRLGVNLSF